LKNGTLNLEDFIKGMNKTDIENITVTNTTSESNEEEKKTEDL